MYKLRVRFAPVLAAVAVSAATITAGFATASAAEDSGRSQGVPAGIFSVHQILSGASLTHSFTLAGASSPTTDPLTDPDDITRLGDDLFVGFQNGVQPQGQPSTDGNLYSTIVELRTNGDPVAQWDVQGKADGVTADPETGQVIVTVNEDANSSLYTIDPSAAVANEVVHYRYAAPLPHNGGTDAISIDRGQILVSASAPGTILPAAPEPYYPAVYVVSLNPRTLVASTTPLFYNEDQAVVANDNVANAGQRVTLGLTDPDSNEIVPEGARFGGDFMLTSQGDLQQIFVNDRNTGTRHPELSVLSLTQSVDDTAWPTSPGALYSTDSSNDAIDVVSGPFRLDQPMAVATPCGANTAPSTCPAPALGYPVNYLASIDPGTGEVNAVTVEGGPYTPQGGLLFVPRDTNGFDGNPR